MSQRKTSFVNEEVYHIYNRGVDKREIFIDKNDYSRFIDEVKEFNTEKSVGSLYELSFERKKGSEHSQFGGLASKLVEIIAYNLNPNHFHLILKQKIDRGIEKFMQKIGTGYTGYFNEKVHRNGSLFQGPFKSVHIDNNEYLLYLSAYVNLNDKIHKIEDSLGFSSLKEYTQEDSEGTCEKSIILEQFGNKKGNYEEFLKKSLSQMVKTKEDKKEMEKYLLEEI